MLHVKIDIVPHGVEEGRDTMLELFIGNDGTGPPDIGNYDVYISDPRGKPYPRNERDGWIGRIERHPRHGIHRGRNELVQKALQLHALNEAGLIPVDRWK